MKKTMRERILMAKSHVTFFFLKLFGKASVFSGFEVNEPIVLRRKKKHLGISRCTINQDKGGKITVVN